MNFNYFLGQWVIPPAFMRLLNKKPVEVEIKAQVDEVLLDFKTLHNIHNGKRCFILGAGSSVKKQDLKMMKGEHVISVSNSYVHKDFNIFCPKYHVLPHIQFGHEALYDKSKFLEWFREMHDRLGSAELFLHYRDKKMIEDHKCFEGRRKFWYEYKEWDGSNELPVIPWQLPNVWSVSELAISFAIYLGYDKIYLLGFDHDWYNGPLVYFYDTEKEHKVQPSAAALPFVDAEFQMRRHAEIFKKYKYLYNMKKNIYNANADQNSYVDVFPKVKYESLFEK